MDNYLGKLWIDGGGGHYSHQESMYLEYLHNNLILHDGMSILEIGPGDGQFALRVIQTVKNVKYCVLDLEKNIFDSVNALKSRGYNIDYCFANNYKILFDKEFDLVVSNVVIPELPVDYRIDLLEHVINKSKSAMIIGQLEAPDQSNYKKWLVDLFEKNFKDVNIQLTPYKNCYAVTGK